MTPLPRGTCPSCGREVALRVRGQVREHRGWPADGVDRRTWIGLASQPICPGSGQSPKKET